QSFTVTPASQSFPGGVTASYTVSDSGGSGLSRVEEWRAPDVGGAPGTWTQIDVHLHSGNGPVSGSFTDSPPAAGTYWYGIHVLDGKGNLSVEPNPPGPLRVTLTQGDTTAPTIGSFSIPNTTVLRGNVVSARYTVSD